MKVSLKKTMCSDLTKLIEDMSDSDDWKAKLQFLMAAVCDMKEERK